MICLANRIQRAVRNYEECRHQQCELTSSLNNLLLCLPTFEGESGKFQVRIGFYPSVSTGLPTIAGRSKTARRFQFVISASAVVPVVEMVSGKNKLQRWLTSLHVNRYVLFIRESEKGWQYVNNMLGPLFSVTSFLLCFR